MSVSKATVIVQHVSPAAIVSLNYDVSSWDIDNLVQISDQITFTDSLDRFGSYTKNIQDVLVISDSIIHSGSPTLLGGSHMLNTLPLNAGDAF